MYSTIGDFASGIYEDLGNPSGISTAYISGWLANNFGTLNILIHTTYSGLSGTIDPWLGDKEQGIYQELFNIKFYERAAATSLNAASYDTWIEIADDGSRVRRVSKNDLAKSFQSQKKESEARLLRLVASYNQDGANPVQVVGDDTFSPVPEFNEPGVEASRMTRDYGFIVAIR